MFQILTLTPLIWLLYIATGIFNFLIARTFNYTGITYLGPSRNASIVSTRILFAAFFALIFIGEFLTIPVLLGTLLAFIGIVLVTRSQETQQEFMKIGLIFPFLTAFFVGLAVILIREADLLSNLPVDGVLIAYVTASILYTPGAMYKQIRSKSSFSKLIFLILSISGILSGIAQISRYSALQFSPVVLVASIVATTPLATMFFSFFFLKKYEILNAKLIIGSIITVAGVILISVSLNAI